MHTNTSVTSFPYRLYTKIRSKMKVHHPTSIVQALHTMVGNQVESYLDSKQLRRAPSTPKQIHMSVTDRCFLPCLHCDIWKNTAEDLPTEHWIKVIDDLSSWLGNPSINFVGGEPLLRSDLETLIRRAKSQHATVSCNTNGWLVTPSRAKSLAQSGIDLVYVSLDGHSEKTVDHSRGKEGSFQKAIQAIELLQEAGVSVMVASVLHAQNAEEMIDVLQFVEDKHMGLIMQPLYQNFGNVQYDKDWWRKSSMFPKTEKELEIMDRVLDKLSIAQMKGRKILNDPKQLQAMKYYFRHPMSDIGISCRAGHTDLSFDPQGRIRLCYFLEPIGSIFQQESISDIWFAQTTLQRRWEVSRCTRSCSMLNCNFA